MANPLFNQFGDHNLLMQRVNQLKAQMGGDPNQHIQNLLNSGQVSQEQYNAVVKRVKQLQQMLE